MSLWFQCAEPDVAQGSFGIDEQGNLRDERSCRIHAHPDSALRAAMRRENLLIVQEEASIRDHRGITVGRGTVVLVPLASKGEVIGCIFTIPDWGSVAGTIHSGFSMTPART